MTVRAALERILDWINPSPLSIAAAAAIYVPDLMPLLEATPVACGAAPAQPPPTAGSA